MNADMNTQQSPTSAFLVIPTRVGRSTTSHPVAVISLFSALGELQILYSRHTFPACNSAAHRIRREGSRLASLPMFLACYQYHVPYFPAGTLLPPLVTGTPAFMPQSSNGMGCDLRIVVD